EILPRAPRIPSGVERISLLLGPELLDRGAPHGPLHDRDHFEDAGPAASVDVVHAPRFSEPAGAHVRLRDILDEREVARLPSVAVDGDRAALVQRAEE